MTQPDPSYGVTPPTGRLRPRGEAPVPGGTLPPEGGLDGDQQDAYQLMLSTLREWGLESLGQTVYDFLVQGYSQDIISLMLRDTEAYKQRFAGNEGRKREGLPVLAPAEYLAVERSYRQIMSAAGVPEGFWDQTSDFANLIGRDVSPVELQRRVGMAVDTAAKLDEHSAEWFRQEYGLDFDTLDRGNLVAYLLDPERGMDQINRVIRGGSIAGAARGRGLQISREQAERFGAAADDAQYGAQAARFAELAARGSFLSDLYSGRYDLETAGEDVFVGDSAAAEERRHIKAREVGTWSGGGSGTANALSSAPGAV